MKHILVFSLVIIIVMSCGESPKESNSNSAMESVSDSAMVRSATTAQAEPDSVDTKLMELNKYCIQCYKSYNALHADLNKAFDVAASNADKIIISNEISTINTKKVQILKTMDAENLQRVKQHATSLNKIMQSFESKTAVLEKFATTLNKVKNWVEKIVTVSEFLISKGIIKPSIPETVAKADL